MVSPLVLPSPAVVGDEWGNSLNVAVQSVNADVEALKARSIAAGLGLTGGGDLTQNRSFAVDFAASGVVSATKAVRADDKRLNAYVITADTHAVTARPEAYPLGFSVMDVTAVTWPLQYGTVTTRFINVNRAAQEYVSKTGRVWVRSGDSALTDGWTPWAEKSQVGHTHVKANITDFAHTHAIADVTSLQTTLDAKALATRLITAGSGLTGGGNLTADRTLALDFGLQADIARSPGAAAVAGVLNKAARADHVHQVPTTETQGSQGGTSGWINSSTAFRRSGIVTLRVNVNRDSQSGTGAANATVFTMPAGWRPVERLDVGGTDLGSGGDVKMYLNTTGTFMFVFGRAAGSTTVGYFTYVCDQS